MQVIPKRKTSRQEIPKDGVGGEGVGSERVFLVPQFFGLLEENYPETLKFMLIVKGK